MNNILNQTIKTRVTGAIFVVLAFGALSGCSAATPRAKFDPSPSARFVITNEQGPSVDSEQYASDLASAVAQQNSASFDSKAVVVDEIPPIGTQASTASFLVNADDSTPVPDPADSQAFTDSLAPAAESTYTDQSELLQQTSDQMNEANLSVDSTTVAVDQVAITQKSEGNTVVTVDLAISRALNTGATWEEVVPYVSSVNTTTGVVTSLVVQDDSWQAAQPTTPTASVHPGDLTPSELGGTAGSPDAAPVSSNTSVSSLGISATTASHIEPASLSASSRAKIVAYANKYWQNRNTAYIASPNDCTNFVSQALYAGGWTKITGWYASDSSWWYDGIPLLPKSYTWASAQNFFNFAVGSGRSHVLSSVYSLTPGEILQYDVGPAGMNHSMIVTEVIAGQPYLTYHTNDVHNKPFSAVQAAVKAEDSTPKWYALSD